MVERGWGDGKDKGILKRGPEGWSREKGERKSGDKVPEFGAGGAQVESHILPLCWGMGAAPIRMGVKTSYL